ncbi:metallophosphoesterase family protein [Ascidiimonas sp. W6]|uniref:metallophosphoesterase family protein n=1 Tax=Ascidiimonas meishanensis TaxID=3128903 RepID=UPI0030ECA2D0
MFKRKLVIGDIHGGLKALIQVLERAKITVDDQLIFLGDYVDGWSESPQVIKFLITLQKTHSCIFIRGNHDELCYKWLKHGFDNPMWLFHGGKATVTAYNQIEAQEKEEHINFLENLDDYHLDSDNKLFVHAGFTNVHGIEREYFSEMVYWDRSLWEMALALNPSLTPKHELYPKRLTHYKEIFIGHTPTIRIGESVPVHAAGIWNVDTGAAYEQPLTIMDTASKEYWQSDPVYLLYPDEKGRN